MPRIDSVTGVPVMTLPEFFASEAEHEGRGRTGGELMSEMFDEIHQDEEQHARRISDPGPLGNYPEALRLLNDGLRECRGDESDPEDAWQVTHVLTVRDANASFGMRQSGECFVAAVKCGDGRYRTLAYQSNQSSGSFFEPPNYEVSVREILGREDRTKFQDPYVCPRCGREPYHRMVGDRYQNPDARYLCGHCDVEWVGPSEPRSPDYERITKGVSAPLYRCKHCVALPWNKRQGFRIRDRATFYGLRVHLYRAHGIGKRV